MTSGDIVIASGSAKSGISGSILLSTSSTNVKSSGSILLSVGKSDDKHSGDISYCCLEAQLKVELFHSLPMS